MTVTELYDKARQLDLLSDDCEQVLEYIRLGEPERGTCATCRCRKTQDCPFPEGSGLTMPVCTTYYRKSRKYKPREEVIYIVNESAKFLEDNEDNIDYVPLDGGLYDPKLTADYKEYMKRLILEKGL